MSISTVGIVGAGTMGNGIAQACAVSGIDVVMVDIAQAAVDKGIATVGKSLDRLVAREKMTEADKAAALGRITGSTRYDDLKGAQLVIEAATERESVKQAIFEDLVPHLKPETILTSNTSSLSITRMASRTDRPEKFMGFHFMNPVPVMQLVELIRGIATDEETYRTLCEVVERLLTPPHLGR